MNTVEEPKKAEETVVPEKSKGQLFKEKWGFSKTLKRNMKKNGLDVNAFSDSIRAYKAIRKKRKAEETKARAKKRDASRGNRSAKVKKK